MWSYPDYGLWVVSPASVRGVTSQNSVLRAEQRWNVTQQVYNVSKMERN